MDRIDEPVVRYSYISALRGIAALSVLGCHSLLLGDPPFATQTLFDPLIVQGRMGVLLFYVLSALSLSLSFSRTSGAILPFYIKRIFRIAPLFYLATAFTAVWFEAHGLADVIWPDLAATVVRNVLFIFNLDVSGTSYKGIAAGAWSIGVEMPFYLIFPVLFRYASTLRRSIYLLTALLLVSAGFRWGLHAATAGRLFEQFGILPPDNVEQFAGQSLFSNLPYFGMGFVAYHVIGLSRSCSMTDRRSFALLCLLIAGLGLVGSATLTDAMLTNPFPLLHVNGLYCTLIVVGLGLYPFRFLVNAVTKFYGEISFSLYLVHPCVIWALYPYLTALYAHAPNSSAGYLAILVVVLATTTIISIGTHRFVETPGIRLGKRISKRFEGRPIDRSAMETLTTLRGREGIR